MRLYSLFGIFLFLLSTSSAKMDYIISRCDTAECLCRAAPISTDYYPLSKNSRRLSLFYREGEYNLSVEQKSLLESFLKGQRTESPIKVVAYTDGCGLPSHNITLGLLRAREVIDIINTSIGRIKIIPTAERYSYHSPNLRRVDITISSSDTFVRRIEENPADFYLLDASGSMSIEKWKKIISAIKKPGSQVWVTKMMNCYSGQKLEKIKPEGGTEIWWAYWHMLDKMKPGQTLLIISDFRSNFPLSISESNRIAEKVRARNIRVIYIKV